MVVRKLIAEAVGTFFLVFFAVGVATLSFGFKFAGLSTSAGVVATALAFGLVLLGLAYALGPISGCHVNPAVTIGFLVSRQISLIEAIGYWVAQFVGGIAGALVLWGVFSGSPAYSRTKIGLGADGYNKQSMIHINVGGAFGAEVILTLLFVFVILMVTSKIGTPLNAGLAIGLTLTLVHLIGIPITGTSVNPARALGPAIVVEGEAIKQVWLFIVAPLVGGILAALLFRYFVPVQVGIASDSVAADMDTVPPATTAAATAAATTAGTATHTTATHPTAAPTTDPTAAPSTGTPPTPPADPTV